MSSIKKWFRKEPDKVTHNDVQDFIMNKTEENINLEYKDIRKYGKFKDIANILCAFANSYGGLFILGVSEEKVGKEKIYPGAITWGEPNCTKERLEDNLLSKIRPPIEGLLIQPIRKKDDSGKVIFLIDIPNSSKKPHISNYRFYKRYNFENKPMDYNEIKAIFLQNQIFKEKWIDNVVGPLYNEIIYVMNNMKNNFIYDSDIIIDLINKYRYMFHQMNEFNLIEFFDYYCDKLSNRNNNLDQIRLYTNNLIKNILLEKYYKSDRTGIITDDPFLSIIATIIYHNLNEGSATSTLYQALLLQIDPIEELKQTNSIIEIKDVKYNIKNRSGEGRVLTNNEFDELWLEIENKIRNNERYQSIWESTQEIKKLTEEAYDYLSDKF